MICFVDVKTQKVWWTAQVPKGKKRYCIRKTRIEIYEKEHPREQKRKFLGIQNILTELKNPIEVLVDKAEIMLSISEQRKSRKQGEMEKK